MGMNHDVVRLVHAQNVPNHYIVNQVYQPTDEDHRKRGTFFILLEHPNTNHGGFAASLVNILVREYYRQTGTDILANFEQTLIRLNDHIQHHERTHEESLTNFQGIFVLSCHNELHITYTGNPLAYLMRGQSLIPLVGESESDPTEEKTHHFSVITSGEIQEGDILSLITGLTKADTLKEDLKFATKHTPLYETTRSYARLLQQKLERAAEALFVQFTAEAGSSQQVYCDKSLETSAERIARLQDHVTKHSTFLLSGVSFLTERTTEAARKAAPQLKQLPAMTRSEPEESAAPIATLVEDTEQVPPHEEAPAPRQTNETPSEYNIRTYRREQKNLPKPEPVHLAQDVSSAPTTLLRLPKKLKPRTLYLLAGTLIALFIIVRIANFFVASPAAQSLSSTERDTRVQQAEDAVRQAEAAEVQDDLTTSVSKLLAAADLLKPLSEKDQTEKSKALDRRITAALAEVTNSAALVTQNKTTSLTNQPVRLVTTKTGTYAFFSNTSQPAAVITDGSLKPLSGFPSLQVLDAVLYESNQKIAIYGKTTSGELQLLSLNLADNTITPLKRSDAKAWPTTRLLASYETNLYFIGETMFKGTYRDGTYRVASYANDAPTQSLTSIVNNGTTFYAVDNKTSLVRLDAKTPKTAIKFFGTAEAFLPKTIDRLISTGKEGSLYLLDTSGKRIILVSTDGGYKRQYTLPPQDTYTDCDAQDTTVACVTDKKELKLFTLP